MTKYLTNRSFASTAMMSVIATALVSLVGCNNMSANTPNVKKMSTPNVQSKSAIQAPLALTPAVQTVVGDYASEGYEQRQQGYDWVGVMVSPSGNEEIDIKVRARSDIKQPSCSYDGKATLMGQDDAHGVIFQTIANDSVTFLQFKDGKLTIDAQDKYALNYFCSGGGTLAGDYQKLNGSLNIS